jgi:hypothetical protein
MALINIIETEDATGRVADMIFNAFKIEPDM